MNDLDVAKAIADRLKGTDITIKNVVEMSSLNRADGNLSIKMLADDYTISCIDASIGRVVSVNIEMGDETFVLRAFISNVMTEMIALPDENYITINLTLVERDKRNAFDLTIAAANTKQKNNRTVWRNKIH